MNKYEAKSLATSIVERLYKYDINFNEYFIIVLEINFIQYNLPFDRKLFSPLDFKEKLQKILTGDIKTVIDIEKKYINIKPNNRTIKKYWKDKTLVEKEIQDEKNNNILDSSKIIRLERRFYDYTICKIDKEV